MAQKAIGPNFANELAAYGIANNIAILGAHFAWHADGTLEFFADTPAPVEAAVQAVYAAHDPTKPDPKAAAAALFAAGIVITCTSTPAVSGTYGTLPPQDEINLTGMQSAVQANVFPGYYRDITGAKHTMTPAQMTELAEAALAFIVAVDDAMEAALAGGAWVAPSNEATIA